MSYVLIEQNLEEEDEPRFIYAELDSGRREVRRVEFYPNGLCFAYGGDYGPEDLRTLNRPGEVTARAITPAAFWEIWGQAQERPDGFMGMFA